ncbi:alkaline phosphatase D family protein [Sphingomonas mucosissima]|uniref:Phospholipase D n=1 Tax=Sphingomonas mucosissima TaxID=370959 RepID=A0A245ZFI4_9SPHN|nr:alkaline phosphatase D family protein [Sphingomonas mucosissima]OWK28483.1 phospholipase D precursor [Sphingomonas mucosissima]
MTFNRRSALTLIGSSAALGLPAASLAADTANVRFAHGVASGDPATDGAVIWTRVTADAPAADVPVKWYVATSADGKPVASGEAKARSAADHTLKVEVNRLKPGQDYWYWFTTAAGQRSPTGRFRTLPVGAVDDLVLAVASCQLYPGGLFNAYADMAALPRLDAVLHLGDYIYEYGAEGYGVEIGQKLGRLPDPPHEILSLSDYRRRHAQVKSDSDMQAAHARSAFICVWDDHEVANDGWIGGAENHDPATEGDWATRKAAAMQAYFEWMPIRDPKQGKSREAINRSFEFGDLATLAMVETRLLARSKQAEVKGAAPTQEQFAAVMAERAQPERELLGADQQRWLEGVLAGSVRANKPWQLLGNQIVMARVAGPDLTAEPYASTFGARIKQLPPAFRDRLQQAAAGYKAGLPFNFDAWDGYPAARERLYAAFQRAGAKPIVLAGDSHAAWANDLYDDRGTLVASEFGATAITSPSYGSLLPGLGSALAAFNREVAYCDQDHKGYTLLTLTREAATAQFVTVSTILAKPFARAVDATYRALPGRSRTPLERL